MGNYLEKKTPSTPQKIEMPATPKYENIISSYENALQLVDDVVLKNYLTSLSQFDVVPLSDSVINGNLENNVLFFKITEMVYEKDEFATYKFASVFNAVASINALNSTIFLLIDSDGLKTNFYMGVRSIDNERTISSLRDTLEYALEGQFPGTKTEKLTIEEIQSLMNKVKDNSISAVTCVANSKSEHLTTNQQFVQGLEKMVLSMQGQKYTGVIIANTTNQKQLRELRKGYETIFSQLSPFASLQINYGKNNSEGITKTHTVSINESDTHTITNTHTEGTTTTTGTSEENAEAKLAKGIGVAAAAIGTVFAPFTGGASLAIGGAIAGVSGLVGMALSKTETYSVSDSAQDSSGISDAHMHGQGESDSDSINSSKGTTHAVTLQAHDKLLENMLERIDKQLKRMDEFESVGMFQCAAYFLSENQYSAEMAATTYKAIVGGENSGVEIAAVNTWGLNDKKTKLIGQYVKNFIHPVFTYVKGNKEIEVTPCSMVSGNELAIHMGLPRKSVCGLPVIEHADFGKEVVKYTLDGTVSLNNQIVNLGKIFNMGSEYPNNVFLDKQSLAMHTFVTGSTGSGKSNAIYEMIRQISLTNRFMIIEPAKGEYKNVFGDRARVFGSNPEYSDLLRINPFRFPKGIHVLEHVDRLIEIFNVCWPMYAAMPAVLKDAVLQSYEVCGWDLTSSKNLAADNFFPSFSTLQNKLVEVIRNSAYSEEVKSNYMGSLVTRVKSLTNGLNSQIFTCEEIDNSILFDENVIVDISRIGSIETKALIMGILIMRLGEYRMCTSNGMNEELKHITILEEAHNILKRTSTEQNPENPNVAGKSVELISNAIAEMRTYGEGFIIVDQSPSAVDISAIRNTNTKIIMRLPDEMDRRLAGKAAGLKDEQLDEIAKLPKGVAVIYQNDWIEPVLCRIKKFKGRENKFSYTSLDNNNEKAIKEKLLELILEKWFGKPANNNLENVKSLLEAGAIDVKIKSSLIRIVGGYDNKEGKDLSKLVYELVYELLDGKQWLNENIQDMRPEVITEYLIQNINNRMPQISNKYVDGSAQCLMLFKACETEEYKKTYVKWIAYFKNYIKTRTNVR